MFSAFVMALLLCSPIISGGEDGPSPTESTVEVSAPSAPEVREHLVVTGQFKPELARDTMVPVRSLGEQEMVGDRDLRELLEAELRLDVQKHSVFGTSLSVGGVSHENVAILINGMPLTGRLDGIIDLEQINLASFDRVEVLEGPGSVYYGSEAQGGVVNLIPRRSGGQPDIFLKAGFRDPGDDQQTFRTDFSLGHHEFSLSASRRHVHGEDENSETRNLDWAERQQGLGSLSWRRVFNHFSLLWYSDTFKEDLTDLGEFNDGFAWDREYSTQRNNHQLTLEGTWSERVDVQLLAGYSDYDRQRTSNRVDSSGPLASRNDPGFDNGFDSIMVKGMVSVADVFPGMDVQLGTEWHLEEGSGGRILDGSQEIENIALFGGFLKRLGRFTVQPMVRVMDNSVYDAPAVPSLHLKYNGSNDLIVRSSYSRGFRGPSVKQLYLDFFLAAGPFRYHITGNESLDAERGHHFTTSLERPLWSGREWRLMGELRGFYSDIDNLIALSTLQPNPADPTLVQRSYINVDQHRSRSGDFTLSAASSRTNVTFGMAYTTVYNSFTVDDPPRKYNDRWDARIEASHQLGAHRFSALIKRVGEQLGFGEVAQPGSRVTVVEEISQPAYERIDLNWLFSSQKTGFTSTVGIKNLADVRNEETVVVSSGRSHEVNSLDWGRRFQVSLGWRWTGGPK